MVGDGEVKDMTQEIQLCKDCKHIDRGIFFLDLALAKCNVHTRENLDKGDLLVGATPKENW